MDPKFKYESLYYIKYHEISNLNNTKWIPNSSTNHSIISNIMRFPKVAVVR